MILTFFYDLKKKVRIKGLTPLKSVGMRLALIALSVLLAAAAPPPKFKSKLPEGKFTADLLIVLENTPIATVHRLAAASRKDHESGRMRTLDRRHVYVFPVVVQDYERPGGGMIEFSDDLRVIGPNRKTHTYPLFGRYVSQDSRTRRVPFIDLEPTLTFSFDPGDPPGRYLIQALVTDRVKGEVRYLEEWFELKE